MEMHAASVWEAIADVVGDAPAVSHGSVQRKEVAKGHLDRVDAPLRLRRRMLVHDDAGGDADQREGEA